MLVEDCLGIKGKSIPTRKDGGCLFHPPDSGAVSICLFFSGAGKSSGRRIPKIGGGGWSVGWRGFLPDDSISSYAS